MQFINTQATSRVSSFCIRGTHRLLAGLLCVSIILAMSSDWATAQGSFASHYGSDASNAARSSGYSYQSSKTDPPYQSHFGGSKPSGHRAVQAPSAYEFGMDADSLYAAGAAQAAYQQAYFAQQQAIQLATAQSFAPYVYYVVPEASSGQMQVAPSPSPSSDGVGQLASLAPGVEWQFNNVNFQDGAEEVAPLPPGDNAVEGDGDGPTFGRQQEQLAEDSVPNTLQFLRNQSVLLDQGERQIDIGMQYAIADGLILQPQLIAQPPDPDVGVVSTLKARQRLLIIPVEIRYGVTDNVQAFCNIPFGWSNAELAIPGLLDEWSNRGGIGDVNCGLSILLHQGCNGGPDIVSTTSFTAPTGDADFFITGGITPSSRLGEGFWAVSTQVLFVHTLDPCAVFYSLGYRHRFDATFQPIFAGNPEVRANPGEQIFYQLGVGFAASERITLSTSFIGGYVTEDHVNGLRVQGGITEPMRMRFSATIAQECKIVEPFAEVGMTRDAAAAQFGITWTY